MGKSDIHNKTLLLVVNLDIELFQLPVNFVFDDETKLNLFSSTRSTETNKHCIYLKSSVNCISKLNFQIYWDKDYVVFKI